MLCQDVSPDVDRSPRDDDIVVAVGQRSRGKYAGGGQIQAHNDFGLGSEQGGLSDEHTCAERSAGQPDTRHGVVGGVRDPVEAEEEDQ